MSIIPVVPTEMLNHARDRAREALQGDASIERIKDYYRIESNSAGSLYLGIPDPDPTAITVADLFAVSSLSIRIPARAARRLLLEPAGAGAVTQALGALPNKALAETDEADLRLMEAFYRAVLNALKRAEAPKPSGAWVTASKIVARKRPDLFPVRDTQVTKFLGTRGSADYFTDWIVFRHLMNDEVVLSDLKRIAGALEGLAESDEHLIETAPLRLLDVALWTLAKDRS